MRQSSIELKSTKYVLTLVMDPSVSFETILADVTDKFEKSARFFRGASMALEFAGRELTEEQQQAVIAAIREHCQLEITCIIEENEDRERAQYEAIAHAVSEAPPAQEPEQSADLVMGSLRTGSRISSDRTILLLGDVEPGAEVISAGSIFVAGCAMGTLRAGVNGDEHAFAAALILKPSCLEICGRRSVSAIRKRALDDSYKPYPQVCTLEDGHMKLDTISGKTWKHIFEKLAQEEKGAEDISCFVSTD